MCTRKLTTDLIADPHVREIVKGRIIALFEENDLEIPPDTPETEQLWQDIKQWMMEAEIQIGLFQERIVRLGGPRFADSEED
jgi:hypothetical protein